MKEQKTSGEGTLQKCPVCNSTDISAGNWDGGVDYASCDVTCDDCGTKWIEEFTCASWHLEYDGNTRYYN